MKDKKGKNDKSGKQNKQKQRKLLDVYLLENWI